MLSARCRGPPTRTTPNAVARHEASQALWNGTEWRKRDPFPGSFQATYLPRDTKYSVARGSSRRPFSCCCYLYSVQVRTSTKKKREKGVAITLSCQYFARDHWSSHSDWEAWPARCWPVTPPSLLSDSFLTAAKADLRRDPLSPPGSLNKQRACGRGIFPAPGQHAVAPLRSAAR